MPKGLWSPLLAGKSDPRPAKIEVNPVVLASRVDDLEVKVDTLKVDLDKAQNELAVAKSDINTLKQPKP